MARSGHPLASRERVTLDDMAQYPWINVGDNFALTSNIVPIFEQMGVRLPQKVVETDSISYLVAHLLRSDSPSYQPRGRAPVAAVFRLSRPTSPVRRPQCSSSGKEYRRRSALAADRRERRSAGQRAFARTAPAVDDVLEPETREDP